MTHRDRAGDPSGQRAGRREAAGPAGHRRGFPTPSGGSPARPEAVSQGFRTAHGFETGRMASDVPHRRATRSWPKALVNRLYGSFWGRHKTPCKTSAEFDLMAGVLRLGRAEKMSALPYTAAGFWAPPSREVMTQSRHGTPRRPRPTFTGEQPLCTSSAAYAQPDYTIC